MRLGSLQVGQTTITFPTGTSVGFSTRPPGVICVPPMRLASRIGRGFVWRVARFRFSTITLRSRGRASTTWPCLPRSLPVSIWTRSPFLTFIDGIGLEHLRSETDDFHEVLLAQLARNRPEDARAARI